MNGVIQKNITQGEFATGQCQNQIITTTLGSCVSACLWDSVACVGGMNHILVPDGLLDGSGVNAMELLINAIIKQGGTKGRLQAKVFGGGRMISEFSNVGHRNAQFALGFLEREGISCQAQSIGGEQARRIQFWPANGKARQKLLGRIEIAEDIELAQDKNNATDVELF